MGVNSYKIYHLDTMQEEQFKDLQADAALEGLDEELSVDELEGVAGGQTTKQVAPRRIRDLTPQERWALTPQQRWSMRP